MYLESVCLYEPIHGSAPDIAGQGIANPAGTLLSLAMLMRHSLGREDAAQALEQAVYSAWEQGLLTADLSKTNSIGTQEFTDAVITSLTSDRAYPNTMLRYM